MPKVVSLLPAATDIVAALGAGDQLIGRTHECDWPADLVRDIPIVTATSLPTGLTSREIADAISSSAGSSADGSAGSSVGSAPHRGSSLYQLDLDALAALAPDVILTQDLCDVCAVSYRSINDAVRVMELDTTVVSLEARTIGEILASIDAIGDLLGVPAGAAALHADLRRRIDALPGSGSTMGSAAGSGVPRVLFIEWLDPLMPGGHWVPEQIGLAGGLCVPLGPGAHSVPQVWSTLTDLAPDVIVLGPCGLTPEQTHAELPTLIARPEWAALPAVRAGQVWIVDGPAFYNRPGPRVVDGAEILAEILASATGDRDIVTGGAFRATRTVGA